MAKLQVIDFDVYKLRYAIGYFITAVAFVSMLVIASFYILGGLTEAERHSVTQSTAFSLKNFEPIMSVDVPYYLLQKASIYLFGVSAFSIKLPSIFLGVVAAIALLFLLKTWFKQNVAILTALLGVTAGPFLLAALSGTPSILYILWPTLILLSASLLTHQTRFRLVWKTALFISIAASLYTPLSIYILFPLIAVCLLHPHIRYTLNNFRKSHLTVALVTGGIILAPLAYCIIKDPSVAATLLGIPAHLDIVDNLIQLKRQYLGFIHPTYSSVMTPVYSLPLVLLALAGVYRIFTAKHTAKSYILVGWLALLLPIVVISPRLISVTFVPVLLLVGYGIQLVIRSWYRLFPKNPYARVAGLIPIVVLIGGLGLSGLDRFEYGYLYARTPDRVASEDLSILKKELLRFTKEDDNVVLYVSEQETTFYQSMARHDKLLKQSAITTTLPTTGSTVIVSHDATERPADSPEKILVNSSTADADRFYIYKKDKK